MWEKPFGLKALALTSLLSLSAVAQSANLISNGTFDDNSPHYDEDMTWPWVNSQGWGNTAEFVAGSENGRYCVEVLSAGVNEWDITLRVEGLELLAGETYEVSADLWSSAEAEVVFEATHETPYAESWNGLFSTRIGVDAPLSGSPQSVSDEFTVSEDRKGAYLAFKMGGGSLVPAGTTVCVDNVVLWNDNYEPSFAEEPNPIQANQLGYLPEQAKLASYVLPEGATNDPRDWQLLDASGTEVASGQTRHEGFDAASGSSLQVIDFSDYQQSGNGYTLAVVEGGQVLTSKPFAIAGDLYSDLKYEALSYFYLNRAGIAIDESLVGEALARPAGHEDDNQTDTYSCNPALRDQPHLSNAFLSQDNCMTLDVSGGWYDAGDFGKYVVNGGIALWTMMNQYERSTHLGANAGDFADGTMAIPESGVSGNPDILDEARWQMEWILSMQVPEGPYEDMAYHKMHGDDWPGMPSYPHEDSSTRYVWPPSTAATLNLAAVGAQCYRVFQAHDEAFANRCLVQAQAAYEAATNNPFLRSPHTEQEADGGGAYEDNVANPAISGPEFVQDEFYWAATELYLATGDTVYEQDMQNNSHHLEMNDGFSAFDWSNTSSLGLLSLAVAGEPQNANPQWVTDARAELISTADQYVAHTESGYGTPFSAVDTYWGSNSNAVNNMVVLGLARDLSQCDRKYADALQTSMSYLLGRNPKDISYVTGVGTHAAEHPHHRVWAGGSASTFPEAPRGVLVGGPNSKTADWQRVAHALVGECDSLACYVDHIDAYAHNEVTINWNAPLAWAVAYMDEMGSGRLPASCGGDEIIVSSGTMELGDDGTGSLDLVALNEGLNGIYELVDDGSLGDVFISVDGEVTYQAHGSFEPGSQDSFTYQVTVDGTTSSPATVTVTQPASTASCQFGVTMDPHQYGNRWQGQVAIENDTGADLTDWEVVLTFDHDGDPATDDEIRLGNQWNPGSFNANVEELPGDATQNAYRLTSNADWNATIAAGATYVINLLGEAGTRPQDLNWQPNPNPVIVSERPPQVSGSTCGTDEVQELLVIHTPEDGDSFGASQEVSVRWFNGTYDPATGDSRHPYLEVFHHGYLLSRIDPWASQGSWDSARLHTSNFPADDEIELVLVTDPGLANERRSEPVTIRIEPPVPELVCEFELITFGDPEELYSWIGRVHVTNYGPGSAPDWEVNFHFQDDDVLYSDAYLMTGTNSAASMQELSDTHYVMRPRGGNPLEEGETRSYLVQAGALRATPQLHCQ